MDWIKDFSLFLFDFDGLLVNTEKLHQKAYERMCAQFGCTLDWSFERYCQAAHHSSTGLRDAIYQEFPEIYAKYPDWTVPYQMKKQAYLELLEEGNIELMPGVEPLLKELQKQNINRSVVTHSPINHIALIRKALPILDTIPSWITREDYQEPKPSPECYQKALQKFRADPKKTIGFEDSPRGLKALLGTEVQAVWICTEGTPELDHPKRSHVLRVSSFEKISKHALNR